MCQLVGSALKLPQLTGIKENQRLNAGKLRVIDANVLHDHDKFINDACPDTGYIQIG